MGVAPDSYPVQANICKWRQQGNARCECGQATETFAHLQLNCTLERQRSARQQAHNRIAGLVEKYSNKIRPQDRIHTHSHIYIYIYIHTHTQPAASTAARSARRVRRASPERVTKRSLCRKKAPERRERPAFPAVRISQYHGGT